MILDRFSHISTSLLGLKRGEELDYRLHTPYGDTVCSGRVIWVRKIDDLWCWGVTFTRVSDQPGDPLRALIEASF